MYSRIVGVGAYLPKEIISNADVERLTDTTAEWITSRTGILSRHFVEDGENTSDIAYKAAVAAVADAGIDISEIGMVTVATVTPDTTFPAVSLKVQAKLGMRHGFAFDIGLGEAGFLSALSTADNAIKTGQITTAVVIGADTMSRLLNPGNRNTYPLFGDGAGAIVLKACDDDNSSHIIDTRLYSDGRLWDAFYYDSGIKMNGKEVSTFAVEKMYAAIQDVLSFNNYSASDIKLLVTRQADDRTMRSVARKIGIDEDKTVSSFVDCANTFSASLPLALTKAVKNGKMVKNDLTMVTSMGCGFTWGASLIRW